MSCARRTGFAILASLLLALAACAPTSFSDLTGVNLIAGGDFSSAGWVADQSATYMDFGAAAGLTYSDGTQAYRLEIKNQLSNGDFEATPVGSAPAGWTMEGTHLDATEYAVVINDANSLDGNTLAFNINAFDRLSFDLHTGTANDLIPDKLYLIRFTFTLTQNLLLLSYNDGTVTTEKTWTIAATPGTRSVFPPAAELNPPDPGFLAAGGPQYFSINTVAQAGARNGWIDDVRVARADITCRIRYVVPFSEAGRPDLVPGWYRFSVSIKADPSATPVTANRFPAAAVSIAIDDATGGNVSYMAQPKVYRPTDAGADWSQWTRITRDFEVTTIPYTSAPGAPMIQLSLTPTDVTGGTLTEDVGSILIAAPSLEFTP